MKRVNHLFDYLISDENLGNAIDEVNATHRWRPRHRPDKTVQRVEADRAGSIEALRTIIVSGFEPSPARKKRRWDKSAGKWRESMSRSCGPTSTSTTLWCRPCRGR